MNNHETHNNQFKNIWGELYNIQRALHQLVHDYNSLEKEYIYDYAKKTEVQEKVGTKAEPHKICSITVCGEDETYPFY